MTDVRRCPRSAAADSVTVNPDELSKFAAMADRWWDPEGEMKPLHALNPTRITFIRDRLSARFGTDSSSMQPLAGLRILDAGCGAGLLTEPLARLGADVVGIDAAEATIKAAKAHAEEQGLAIDYRCTTVEDLAAHELESFDAVLAMEVVEHVADVNAFLDTCGLMVRPGGAAVVATINRTSKSFLLAKVGAEYVLGWLPRGTHAWRKFVRPSEVANALRPAGLVPREVTGVAYDPLTGGWKLSRDPDVNYMLYATKPG
jgi:2-polyprenyl-6-hydroxyphenyl methylase/3-demethylubiquinone-9 3-methyltransferase